ncbi:ATP-binding protein [Falsiroseomonas sp. HC035]|uniref:PAS domain-containing sensor histidine kinase n=1 Tax=Falsiroseomonas sp. HC035 TaxID=3390999 RepID=UPI003D3165F3
MSVLGIGDSATRLGVPAAPQHLVQAAPPTPDKQRLGPPRRLYRPREAPVALAAQRLAEPVPDRLSAYFDNASECLFHVRVTPEGEFLYELINRVCLAHAGATMDEVRGRTPVQVLGEEVGGVITQGLRRVLETKAAHVYEPTIRFGTETIIYDARYMPLLGPDGAVVGILGRATDITQRRHLETSLRQAQKMEALGQLAGGVAHDFNNVLAALAGCLSLIGREPAAREREAALLAEARRTIERGSALTARLLSFARQQPLATEALNVSRSLADMAALFNRTLGGRIRVTSDTAPDLWPALADRNHLELALLNLAINARDAMATGGELAITACNRTIAEPPVEGLAPGDYVAIALADTGTGMAPEVLARAMEPFFTTKAPDHGTGLGLSMVYGMLRQIGGGLHLRSSPGAGTCVTLFLPRVPEAEVG